MNKPVCYIPAATGYYIIGPMLQTDAPLRAWRMPIIAWAVEETRYDKPSMGGGLMFSTCEPVCAEVTPSNWHAILDPLGHVTVPSECDYDTLEEYLASDATKEHAEQKKSARRGVTVNRQIRRTSMDNEDAQPVGYFSVLTHVPTWGERAWRAIGFRFHLGDEPDGINTMPGWSQTRSHFNFSINDRLRLMLTGRLTVITTTYSNAPSGDVTRTRMDWEIHRPGSKQ